MTDEEVLTVAADDGFELEERPCGGVWYGAGAVAMISGGPATSKNVKR